MELTDSEQDAFVPSLPAESESRADLLRHKAAADIVVFGGGIIPQDDVPRLKDLGTAEVFLPGSSTEAIIEWIRAHIHPRRAA